MDDMFQHDRAVVMISIGEQRSWSRKAAKTFEHYCRKVDADMHYVTEYPTEEEFPLPEMPDSPGRRNKRAYACKAYFAWKFLEEYEYDWVAVVDDTCSISPSAPDLFDLVPEGACGYTGTSAVHAEKSFAVIRDFIEKTGEPPIEYNPREYMNSGVMVYHRDMRDAFHKDKIIRAAPLLYAKYPNQTLTYYLLKSGKVPLCRLPKSFNSIPAMDLPKENRSGIVDIKPHMSDKIYIYHITGAFERRSEIVEQVADILIDEWSNEEAKLAGKPA